VVRDARACTKPQEGRQGRLRPARVNEANRTATRGAFHRTKTFAPQRPFERPAPAYSSVAALPPRCWHPTLLRPRFLLAEAPRVGSPSTRPVAGGCRASLDLGVVRRLLQPYATHGHTHRAADPRARVELSPRYSLAPTDASCVGLVRTSPHGGPAGRELHATACAYRVPLAWKEQLTGRGFRAKAYRAPLTGIARALLVKPRAPESPVRFAAGPG